jgi:hypothetical protein
MKALKLIITASFVLLVFVLLVFKLFVLDPYEESAHWHNHQAEKEEYLTLENQKKALEVREREIELDRQANLIGSPLYIGVHAAMPALILIGFIVLGVVAIHEFSIKFGPPPMIDNHGAKFTGVSRRFVQKYAIAGLTLENNKALLELQKNQFSLDNGAFQQAYKIKSLSRYYRDEQQQLLERNEGYSNESESHDVPALSDLLESKLYPGGKMILGYENGQPLYGTLKDVYSPGVFGESGSGKTVTTAFLIGSAALTCGAKSLLIDPHYPSDESLGTFLEPLIASELVSQPANEKNAIRKVIEIGGNILRGRLLEGQPIDTPLIIIIEEILYLHNKSYYHELMSFIESVSSSGRKVNVFCLVTSQDLRKSKGLEFRDVLTSTYLHRLKKHQANLLIQDKQEAEWHHNSVQKAGRCLFMPSPQSGDKHRIIDIPYSTSRDMERIADLCKK